MKPGDILEIDKPALGDLIAALKQAGYRTIGPRIGDGAIVYDDIAGLDDLPRGTIDDQEAGRYRLRPSGRDRFFDFVVGPHSWKQFLFPPKLAIGRVTKTPDGLNYEDPDAESPPQRMAFIGARACELAAIRIQDRVFTGGPFVDRHYQRRREDAFIVAVNCTRPGGTCFCTSMETGPRASHTFDLALTELDAAFIVEIGTEIGATILAKIESRRADSRDAQTAEQLVGEAADKMGRKLDTEGLPELMLDRLDDPVWDRVAERCLSCTNCTMVCPTCFCSTVVEVNDLTDETSIRERVWDSCYSMDFAYIHKGTRRPTVKDRYRQWLTHKLATWRDQFETSGCVGCGRCITWCPPGIDLTEEAAALRASAERDRKA